MFTLNHSRFLLLSVVCLTAMHAFAAPLVGPGGSFQGLGVLPGGGTMSEARDISADGRTVVGWSSSASGREAFRWTQGGGMSGLGSLPGPAFASEAWSVSADGNTIVGQAAGAGGRWEPFRWTSSGGMQSLGFGGFGYGVSGDGNVVVGVNLNEAFRWTSAGGTERFPGTDAFRVSADGNTVIGRFFSQGYRWTSAGGAQTLSLPPGAWESAPWGLSADGNTVVGRVLDTRGYQAVRWTGAGEVLPLGVLPGGAFFSEAHDVSADGSTIVGFSDSANGSEAFIWDAAGGMRPLSQVLAGAGVDLSGWTLRDAWGISDDGTVIVGNGLNPFGNEQAWIAVVPEPSVLALAGFGAAGWLWLRRRRR